MKIPYLTSKRLASGKAAYYLNIPRRLIPEGCEISSSTPLGDDYILACQKGLKIYQELKSFRKNPKQSLNKKTIRYLWIEYKTTRLFTEISPRTQKQYTNSYKFLENKKNKQGMKLIDTPLDLFDWKSANKLYEQILSDTNIFDTKRHFAFLRLIYSFGVREKIFSAETSNPFSNMKIKLPKPKRQNIPREDVIALINKAKEMGLPHVALAIELDDYICQRPADVLKLRKNNIYQKEENYFICFTQNKTGEEMRLPVPPHLIKEILSKEDYLISDKLGSFTVDRFSRHFKKVRDALGLNCVFRLMRHTGGTAYIESGASTAETILFTGHKEERIFNEVYKSPTERISLNALNKRLAAENKKD